VGRRGGAVPPPRRERGATIEPLRLSFDVGCPPDRAFALWTERIATWWPADHTATGEDDATVVLQPFVGGRIFERTRTGDEIAWGEVTAWEPPRRLAYLWHLRADRADATDVEVAFVERPDGTTRVEIEHSGWELLGDRGDAWRARNERGWTTLIPHYEEATRR
jgi:uncharacterized protein YndB with AHSA1/START domain